MSYYNQGQPPIGVPPPQGMLICCFLCDFGVGSEGFVVCDCRSVCWFMVLVVFFYFLFQGYPPEGYPKDAYPPPGYPPQGYPPPGAYPPQGYPPPYAPQYAQPPPQQQSSGPGCLEGW